MKHKKRVILFFCLYMCFLSACGIKKDDSIQSRLKTSTEQFEQIRYEDRDINIPEGNYTEMSRKRQMQYQEEIEAQLAYDEYFILQDGNDNLMLMGPDGKYFNSLEKAQAIYEGLDVKESIGDYHLTYLRIHSFFTPEDKEVPRKVMKRTFSTENIFSINLLYENEERAFSYERSFGTDPSDDIAGYERNEKLEGAENAWLLYIDGNNGDVPDYYLCEDGEDYFKISQGSLHSKEDGGYQTFSSEEETVFSQESLMSLVELVKQESPIVQIKK